MTAQPANHRSHRRGITGYTGITFAAGTISGDASGPDQFDQRRQRRREHGALRHSAVCPR
jgi:hypothetical protein